MKYNPGWGGGGNQTWTRKEVKAGRTCKSGQSRSVGRDECAEDEGSKE